MDNLILNIFTDNQFQSYDGYVPDDWGGEVFKVAEASSTLHRLLANLMLSWRTTAYTASMPSAIVKCVQASTIGHASFTSPDGSIVSFAENIIAKVSRKVPELVQDRNLRSQLIAELASTADEFRTARGAITPDIPIEPIWADFLKQNAFTMGMWASQRVSYVAFYNAYEVFIIDCAKQALSSERLRTNYPEFKEALRNGFCQDVSHPCWNRNDLNHVRLIRHALSHAGGRETNDLKNQRHGIKLLDGVLQIVPDDIHRMLEILRAGVEALVAAAIRHPRFP